MISWCVYAKGWPTRSRLPPEQLFVKLLGPLVKSDTLSTAVDYAKPSDAELLPSLHDCVCPPTAFLQELLPPLELLLRHHLASGVQHEVRLDEAPLGVGRGAVPHLAV